MTVIQGDIDALTLPHMAHGTAICGPNRLNVRAQPSMASQIVGQLVKDQPVIVWALEQDWMIVQAADGLTGWASTQYLKVDGKLVA